LFFVGKGGVGKSVVACATAIDLAEGGRKVLLVSTDPASNLAEMLATNLGSEPSPIVGVSGLQAMNLTPAVAADAYRKRVLAPLRDSWPSDRFAQLEAEFAGACTVEVALLDAFAELVADDTIAQQFDHVLFDTAPTGHTLRLLDLPGLWSEFLSEFDDDLPLRPYFGLGGEIERLRQVATTIRDARATTFVLVIRPANAAVIECARTLSELQSDGVDNFVLAVNGVFHAADPSDQVAVSLEQRGMGAMRQLPSELATLPRITLPLRAEPLVGVHAFRRLLHQTHLPPPPETEEPIPGLPTLSTLVNEIAANQTGLVVVVGKGGVGKTTVAAAIATELARLGLDVDLTTTDPAGQLESVVGDQLPGLRVYQPDPAGETAAYVAGVLDARVHDLSDEEAFALEYEMASPCAQDVAMFRAFARMVADARQKIVVLDAAATGHTLLLVEQTGAYHRGTLSHVPGKGVGRIVTPLMRLQDPSYSKVILVTLPEATPVSEAEALQGELRKAQVEPWAWVINQSLANSGTRDPVLRQRIKHELQQIARVRDGLANRLAVVRWLPEEPHGPGGLHRMLTGGD